MNAQDRKVKHMRNKLNQSVDFANIKNARLERDKVKYSNNPAYKNISEAMTFRSNVFDENMERGLDLVNSPIQPA